MKRKRVKCRHCRKGFLVEPGKFPKKLFDHIRKKHPNARRKSSEKTHSKPRGKRSWRKRHRTTSESPNDVPDAPVGFVVETVTYRRA